MWEFTYFYQLEAAILSALFLRGIGPVGERDVKSKTNQLEKILPLEQHSEIARGEGDDKNSAIDMVNIPLDDRDVDQTLHSDEYSLYYVKMADDLNCWSTRKVK